MMFPFFQGRKSVRQYERGSQFHLQLGDHHDCELCEYCTLLCFGFFRFICLWLHISRPAVAFGTHSSVTN